MQSTGPNRHGDRSDVAMGPDYCAYESGTIPDMTLPHAFQLDLSPASANMRCMNQTSTDGIL